MVALRDWAISNPNSLPELVCYERQLTLFLGCTGISPTSQGTQQLISWG
jgi:hypothetical protein